MTGDQLVERWKAAAGATWVEPHRAGSAEEESFEWWKGSRNLTVFVRPGEPPQGIRVWAPNIHDGMALLRPC